MSPCGDFNIFVRECNHCRIFRHDPLSSFSWGEYCIDSRPMIAPNPVSRDGARMGVSGKMYYSGCYIRIAKRVLRAIHECRPHNCFHMQIVAHYRAKLYRFKTDEKTWGDMGVGLLRLMKHTTNDARRIVLRNDMGKVILILSCTVSVHIVLRIHQAAESKSACISFVLVDKGSRKSVRGAHCCTNGSSA